MTTTTSRITRATLEHQLQMINAIAKAVGHGGYSLESSAMGRVDLVDSAGRGVLGIPTPFGVTGVSKREMSAQLDAFEQGWGQALRAVCAPR